MYWSIVAKTESGESRQGLVTGQLSYKGLIIMHMLLLRCSTYTLLTGLTLSQVQDIYLQLIQK